MNKPRSLKIISALLCLFLFFQQAGLAQFAPVELNISGQLASLDGPASLEGFCRYPHLRYLSYNAFDKTFNLLLDKGDRNDLDGCDPEASTRDLLNYFFTGIALPNKSFWVNLRPDSPDEIIDPLLAQTAAGRILLESDLQLKKDVAGAISPKTPEGKRYWERIYEKAAQLYGSQKLDIPTLTRPWIVPDEIIIGESAGAAYVYKATLKVMLEQDYLKDSAVYSFEDPRARELNEYSSRIIREEIIPRLNRRINSAECYAPLRQVYYSLILAQWFKARHRGEDEPYCRIADSGEISNLRAGESYSVSDYFKAYKDNFEKGEYNIKEQVYTPYGQVVRSYFSGGIAGIAPSIPEMGFPASGPVTVIPDSSLDGREADASLIKENASVDGNLQLKISPDWDQGGAEKNVSQNVDTARSRAIERINTRIENYTLFQQSIELIAGKLGKADALSEADIVVLEDLQDRLMLMNSLVSMELKVHQGDIIIVNNQASIKFLNTLLGESEVGTFISLRQSIVTELLLRAGLIESPDVNTLSVSFKQDKFVIDYAVVEYLGQAEVLRRLKWVAENLSSELTENLHNEYKDNKAVRDYTFLFNFGVSLPVEADNDDARILADIQALQAAKMGRRFGAKYSMFDQREFDVLMLQAEQTRQKLGLSPGQLPPQEIMKGVREKTEEGLELEVKNGVKGAQEQLLIKKYLDIIDLFDYPKYWRANPVRRTEEKEGILKILKGLDRIMGKGPALTPAEAVNTLWDAAGLLWEASTVIGTNPKNHRIVSGESFLANAAKLFKEEDGRLIAVDVIGFWADIQQNLANAHQRYMQGIEMSVPEKEASVLGLCLEADDLVKRKMAAKLGALAGVMIGIIPSVNYNQNKRFLVNQEGGDEIIFYIHGQYDWDALVGRIAGKDLGVGVTAVRTGDGDFGNAYFIAQQSDSKVKALEDMGVMSAVVSLEINDLGVPEWFVYYRGKRTSYDEFYRQLQNKNSGPGEGGGETTVVFNQETKIVLSQEGITEDLPILNEAAKEALLGPEYDFKEKIFLLFGVQTGAGYRIERIIPVLKYSEQRYGYAESDQAEIARLIDEYAMGEIKLVGVLHTHPYDVTKIITKPGPSWQDGLGEDMLLPDRLDKIVNNPIGIVLEGTIPEDFSIDNYEDAHLSAGIKAYFYLTEENKAKVFKIVDFWEWVNQGMPENNDKENKGDGGLGGIDFRYMPVVASSLDNFKMSMRDLPLDNLRSINLRQERFDIEHLVRAGILPSKERLREYFAASLFKGDLEKEKEGLFSCIAAILKMEESSGTLTDPMLKDILALLGSGRSQERLKQSLF
ncbi:MAG: hypothetical protein PHW98_02420 [Candidatus Omnitrophica bacterium]|nr:hypothetical protein [Candidatus Omnitrophota bacterium]